MRQRHSIGIPNSSKHQQQQWQSEWPARGVSWHEIFGGRDDHRKAPVGSGELNLMNILIKERHE